MSLNQLIDIYEEQIRDLTMDKLMKQKSKDEDRPGTRLFLMMKNQ